MTDNRKIYSRRPMKGLKSKGHEWAAVSLDALPLSYLLFMTDEPQLFLCGSSEQMSREYVEEPLKDGWEFVVPYVHKHRAPSYVKKFNSKEKCVDVKLIGHREGWFPGCEDIHEASDAYRAFEFEWGAQTSIPLLSTPSKTGQALLWENLPRGQQFPALPAEVEKVIRANSTQHRKEAFRFYNEALDDDELYQYDGRWMYAALATLDRLPIGEPVELEPGEGFKEFQPGWYYAAVMIPNDWNHIGLLPMLTDDGWEWPSRPGGQFEGWFCEPELTLAIRSGWHISVRAGWKFAKGRPLCEWAKKLIKMRRELQEKARRSRDLGDSFGMDDNGPYERFDVAAKAPRQILNHTIGSLYARGYEREEFVSDDNWVKWLIEHPDIVERQDVERAEGGYIVPCYAPDTSPLSINLPHLAATIWSLERAFVAKAVLKCDPRVLVKINGDAIYATAELPFTDNGNLGQLRRKA